MVGGSFVAAARMLKASYVLPLRRTGGAAPSELTRYLAWLAERVDVIVVDSSAEPVRRGHAADWEPLGIRHVARRDDIPAQNGKVAGVLTGLPLARFDFVVIADDDVRYDGESLERVVELLEVADLVRPQNYFDPVPWHACWDTARTLLNRVGGGDYPGTLAVRRQTIPDGYDGDVLFENLELMRTVRARGGRIVTPLDCYVRRLPPDARHFWSQRVRQAYDDLAQPWRLVASLAVVPGIAACILTRRWRPVAAAAGAAVVVAEAGRRRAGGRAVFPAAAAFFAPLWITERGICSWLAVGNRLLRGGCPYHGSILRRAASSPRRLRRQSRSQALQS